MERNDLIAKLEDRRDEAAPIDTDTAAVLAVLVRMLRSGESITPVMDACFEAEARELDRKPRSGLRR